MKKFQKDVVVVGGGVSGLVFANACRGATVIDPCLPAKDRGLGIWPNARSVLQRLDIWDQI